MGVLTDHRGPGVLYGCIGHVSHEEDVHRRPAAPGDGGEIKPAQQNWYLLEFYNTLIFAIGISEPEGYFVLKLLANVSKA